MESERAARRIASARRMRRLAPILAGVFLLGGCNPTIQATVESGIISSSQAVLNAFFGAIVNILTNPNG